MILTTAMADVNGVTALPDRTLASLVRDERQPPTSKDPAPRQILTGKQEHCDTIPLPIPQSSDERNAHGSDTQISNASSSTSRCIMRFKSCRCRRHCRGLELPFDPNTERSLPSTPIFPSYDTSSFIMPVTFPFSIRLARRSSGKINYKWCVVRDETSGHRSFSSSDDNDGTDALHQFLESFANKHISSSEDRLEETKRRKLALKCEKVVELMMVSGVPTASGYEERIRFSEMEVVERGANDSGLLVNAPDGRDINGWDVNVAGVRTTSVKRTVRYHSHAVRKRIRLRSPAIVWNRSWTQ